MKAKSINVQITKNLGNYESTRIGGEWELNGESMEDAIKAAVEELEQVWATINPKAKKEHVKPAESPNDNMVVFGSKLCQAIVNRVSKDASVTMEQIKEHYTLDEESERVIDAAIKLRAK